MPSVLPRHAAATLVEAGGRGSVATVRFNNEGRYLVSGGSDRRLRLWSAASGGLAKAYVGHTAGINDASFSGANDRIASGGGERLVYVWDVSRDEPTAKLRGHQDAVSAVQFTAGDNVLVSGSHDATVKFWDLRGLRSAARSTTHFNKGHPGTIKYPHIKKRTFTLNL
ncbi:putative WD repeat-containing protein [Diplonema papillatum]|nr:putative WD repeat-containing protein [Diplonema papillatum]